MRRCAHGVLIAAVLLAGCHNKASTSHPPPTPPPVAMAAPPPPPDLPPPLKRVLVPARPPAPPVLGAAPPAAPASPAEARPAGSGVAAGFAVDRALRDAILRKQQAAAALGAPPSTTSQPASSAQNDEQQIHTWYQGLPAGFVRYTAPTQMVLGNQYTVSAYIPPIGTALDPVTTDPKKARTVDKNIKVSPYMRVSLAAPANPDSFKIQPPTQDCRFVSLDGATRWDFLVTPLQSGANQTLTFTTTVLYGSATNACDKANPNTIDVTTDTETVQVQAINARDAGRRLEDDAVQHPGKWVGYLKYVLPGGAIFTFFAGIAAWWKKRSAAKATP